MDVSPKKRSFSRGNVTNQDDPLEGPSWRYSNGASDTSNQTHNGNDTIVTRDRTNDSSQNESMESSRSRLNETSAGVFNGSLRDSVGLSATNRLSLTTVDPNNQWDGSDEDDDRCGVINMPNRDDDTTTFTTLFSRNVCMSRGRTAELDPDEFTMMRKPNKPFKVG